MMNLKRSKRPPQNRHGHSPNGFFEKAALPHTTGGAAAPTASEGGNRSEATLTKTFKETESHSKISRRRTAASEDKRCMGAKYSTGIRSRPTSSTLSKPSPKRTKLQQGGDKHSLRRSRENVNKECNKPSTGTEPRVSHTTIRSSKKGWGSKTDNQPKKVKQLSRMDYLRERYRNKCLSGEASHLLLASWRPKSSKSYDSLV